MSKSKTVQASITKPNKNRLDLTQRQRKAENLRKVAALFHAGMIQEEMADKLGVSQGTVSLYLKELRERWLQQAIEKIDDWKARELAYAVEQRTQVEIQWRTSKEPRFNDLMIKWTDRISKLLGLDAPLKIQDVTREELIKKAQASGINNPLEDPGLAFLIDCVTAERNN